MVLEALEQRRLLTSLTFIASAGDDVINFSVVGTDYVYSMNGLTPVHEPVAGYDAIYIRGAEGNDQIIIDRTATAAPLTVLGEVGNDSISLFRSSAAVTADGGPGDDDISIANSTLQLDDIGASVTVTGGAGTDTLRVNDIGSGFDDAYTIDATAMSRTLAGTAIQRPVISYTGVQNLTLGASNGNNTITLERSPIGDGDGGAGAAPTDTISLFGDGGDDFIELAPTSHNLHGITHHVVVAGDAGDNTMFLHDESTFTGQHYDVTDNSVAWLFDGSSVDYSTLKAVYVYGSATGTDFFGINSTHVNTFVYLTGGSDGDALEIGGGNLDSIRDNVTFDGAGGNDQAYLNDIAFSFGAAYAVNDATATWGSAQALTRISVERLYISSGAGADSFVVNTATPFGTNVFIGSGDGADTVHVDSSGLGTSTSIDTGPGDDIVTVNRDDAGTAAAVFNSAQTIGSLSIGAGGTALVSQTTAGDSTLTTRSLSINSAGTLNLTNNAMVVDYSGASPLATIRALLAQGYNAGNWLGAGITSSTAALTPQHALGYAETSDLTTIPAVFGAPDSTSMLVRYTRSGDATLDQLVNLNDFNRLAGAFGSGNLWSRGNFNFDSTVNLNDFNLLASNFGLSSSPDDLLH